MNDKAVAAKVKLEKYIDDLNPKLNLAMRSLAGILATVNQVIADLNSNIDSGLVADAPPPVVSKKADKGSAQAANVNKPPGPTLSAEILARAKEITAPWKIVYRANGAMATRRYILEGFGIVHNGPEERQLGPGLYGSIDRRYAQAYTNRLRDLPTVVEYGLTAPAKGIEVRESDLLDGTNVAQIQDIYDNYDFIYFNDVSDGQVKFHPRYYLTKIQIAKVWVREDKDKDIYKEYSPENFVREYVEYQASTHREKASRNKQAVGSALKPEASKVPPSAALQAAPDAEPWMLEAINYQEEAEKFEANLARYAITHKIAVVQVQDLVKRAWELFPDPKDRAGFGTAKRGVTGMVGDVRHDIEGVVQSGNIREQLAFLYNGYVNRVFNSLNANKDLPRPTEMEGERRERKKIEHTGEAQARTSQNPHDVSPPLSETEWAFAVDKTGGLTWEPGTNIYEYKMASEFQKVAEAKSALVTAGTSGTAFGILQVSDLLAAKGAKVDHLAVRLALLGWMLSAGDHTFHEIMVACQMYDPTLAYDDTYRRYRHILPLGEEELRQNVAPGHVFPDEHLDQLVKETAAFK